MRIERYELLYYSRTEEAALLSSDLLVTSIEPLWNVEKHREAPNLEPENSSPRSQLQPQ